MADFFKFDVADLAHRIKAAGKGAAGRISDALAIAQKAGTLVPPPAEPPPAPLAEDPSRRHIAEKPGLLSARGWWEVARQIFDEIFRDRLMLVAAGVAFYVMLSLFPALSVLIWIYGFFADPAQIVSQLKDLAFILPSGTIGIIEQQALAISAAGRSNMNTLIVASILIAVWSANAGMKSIFEAMNIIYGEDEKRSFVAINLRSMLFTLGALAIFLATLVVLVAVPVLLAFVNLQSRFALVPVVLRWPILYAITVVFLILLNRYGPSRPPERARWAIWGSALGAGLWIAVSLAFSWYVDHIGNLAATYGSIAAIAGLMLWLWLSALVMLVGVELNHELELRTLRWEDHQRHLQAMEEWRRRNAAHGAPAPSAARKSLLRRWLLG